MIERKLRSDAQHNREAILDAAAVEIRTRGVDASIDEIAARAGVGVGTVYRNYPTKEALMEAILSARVQPLVAMARDACAAEDAGAAFFGFLHRVVDESGDFKGLADAMDAAGFDFKTVKREVTAELFAVIAELLARAQQSGAVRSDVAIDDVGMLMAGIGHSSYGDGSDQSRRSRCVDLVCDALRLDVKAAAEWRRAAG
jgi:AcrR family transcriptional regulator